MTVSADCAEGLTDQEWTEMLHLKEAISYYPFSISSQKMELFTELFVKSIKGKGDFSIINC